MDLRNIAGTSAKVFLEAGTTTVIDGNWIKGVLKKAIEGAPLETLLEDIVEGEILIKEAQEAVELATKRLQELQEEVSKRLNVCSATVVWPNNKTSQEASESIANAGELTEGTSIEYSSVEDLNEGDTIKIMEDRTFYGGGITLSTGELVEVAGFDADRKNPIRISKNGRSVWPLFPLKFIKVNK